MNAIFRSSRGTEEPWRPFNKKPEPPIELSTSNLSSSEKDTVPEKQQTHSRYGFTRITSSINSIISPEEDHPNREDGNICRIHNNTIAGIMQGTGSFLTYSLFLFDVEAEFNELMANWNKNYPKAVQIFNDGPSGLITRGCIQALHAQLYRRGSSDRTRKENLHGAEDFIKIFQQGAKQGWIYTYVLHGDKFKCSETGITLTKDLTSKHAVHANASPSVRCAGEFHFQPDDGVYSYKLILDNNSGTYAPTMQHLECLKKTLERNFKNLKIEIYDYKSEKLRYYLDYLKVVRETNAKEADTQLQINN
jgi:hypothetical protein